MKTYEHITIDLETLGNTATAAILAIGAVAFNTPDSETEEFYVNIDLDTCLNAGLTVSASTFYWWLTQDLKAQMALIGGEQDLDVALVNLLAFCQKHLRSNAQCWTHATFDAPILGYACSRTGIQMPVHFRDQRDIRTLECLKPWSDEIKREGTHHNALDDARYQARYIRKLLNS